jgi:aryl-alcohol dehydrogenase-like predicted oxidoreductase
MKTIPLGTTGRRVSRIGLGGMPLSIRGRPDEPAARAVVRRAVELGVTLIDTADAYCLDDSEFGNNERLIAAALREVGVGFGGRSAAGAPAVVVATKGGMVRPDGRWERDGRPDHIRAACHASLRALGVERLDLYQFHTPDARVPFADSVGAFAALVEVGKVDAVGLSNVNVQQIREAQAIVPIASVQNRLCPWDVSWDAAFRRSPVIEHCRREGITFIPYSPLGGSHRVHAIEASPELLALAREHGCTPSELVLAWMLRRGPHVAAIPGASRTESVESSVRADALVLDRRTDARVRRAFAHLPGAEGMGVRIRSKLRRVFGGGG